MESKDGWQNLKDELMKREGILLLSTGGEKDDRQVLTRKLFAGQSGDGGGRDGAERLCWVWCRETESQRPQTPGTCPSGTLPYGTIIYQPLEAIILLLSCFILDKVSQDNDRDELRRAPQRRRILPRSVEESESQPSRWRLAIGASSHP
jgi:hypothetical protein